MDEIPWYLVWTDETYLFCFHFSDFNDLRALIVKYVKRDQFLKFLYTDPIMFSCIKNLLNCK